MKNIKKYYSFELHTQYIKENWLNLISISGILELPMDKVVLRSDGLSFRYLMDESTAEMIIRILFQLPGVTKVVLLKGKSRQTLSNPFVHPGETEI